MALPLLWLGAAAVSAIAAKTLADDRKEQQRQRGFSYKPTKLSELPEHDSSVAIYPTDVFKTYQKTKPVFGSLVCCGIGGLLDHSGIWVGEDTIVELDGNGLIKPLSSERFTHERSGKNMFIACDSTGEPLSLELAGQRAIKQIYQYRDYHLLENNCHQFIWQCFQPNDKPLTTFKELNQRLASFLDRKIYWDICDLN
ncbi:hypothetical protein [Thalassotalea atypica]|uniref:hypothetical protein n=1 Tax=Thalassotalea atypica TaxID=2054316 RepID=UPI0025729BB1|nr:hypothetical protein [Thalassotalea atypica]